jgi:putative flippase GtrA
MFWQRHHRYITIGVSIYLFELAVIVVGQRLGLSAVGAVALSFWLGLLVSFGLQKTITFKDHRVHHKVLLPQIIAFSLLVLFNFGFTIVVTKLLSPGVPAVLSRTIALAITTLWNYYLYKTHIFYKNEV